MLHLRIHLKYIYGTTYDEYIAVCQVQENSEEDWVLAPMKLIF